MQLCKQKLAWRIIENPSTLLSRVIRAKYGGGSGWWNNEKNKGKVQFAQGMAE